MFVNTSFFVSSFGNEDCLRLNLQARLVPQNRYSPIGSKNTVGLVFTVTFFTSCAHSHL
jgi:hypothetical protein